MTAADGAGSDRRLDILTSVAMCTPRAGVLDLSMEDVAHATSMTVTEVQTYFPSMAALYGAFLDSLQERQLAALSGSYARRRSLMDAVLSGMTAYWNLFRDAPNERLTYLMLTYSFLTHPSFLPTDDPGPYARSAAVFTTWLTELERTQAIRWSGSVAQLARLTSGTMVGMIHDPLLAARDSEAVNVLKIVAFDVAQLGRRLPRVPQQRGPNTLIGSEVQ